MIMISRRNKSFILGTTKQLKVFLENKNVNANKSRQDAEPDKESHDLSRRKNGGFDEEELRMR